MAERTSAHMKADFREHEHSPELVERVAKAIYFANDRFSGDEEVAARAALNASGHAELLNALRGLYGLVQLLAANHETPPALLRILTENHRVTAVEQALAKYGGQQ